MSTAIIAGAAAGGAALLLIGIGSLFMGSSDVKPREEVLSIYRNTGEWGDDGAVGQGISSKKHKHKKGSTKRRKSSGKGSKKK